MDDLFVDHCQQLRDLKVPELLKNKNVLPSTTFLLDIKDKLRNKFTALLTLTGLNYVYILLPYD